MGHGGLVPLQADRAPRLFMNDLLCVHHTPGPWPGGDAGSRGRGQSPETWHVQVAVWPRASSAGRGRGDGRRIGLLQAPSTEGDTKHPSRVLKSNTDTVTRYAGAVGGGLRAKR